MKILDLNEQNTLKNCVIENIARDDGCMMNNHNICFKIGLLLLFCNIALVNALLNNLGLAQYWYRSRHRLQQTTSTDERDQALKRLATKNQRGISKPYSQKWYRDKQQFISKKQKELLRQNWPYLGIHLTYNTTVNFTQHFNRSYDNITLDIGFGTGESIVFNAQNNKHNAIVGCELHRASIAATIEKVTEQQLDNVRLIRADATLLLENHLDSDSLNIIQVFFPDPWPNTERDGERRVIRLNMLKLFLNRLRSHGTLRVATDVPDYYQHVQQTIIQCNTEQEEQMSDDSKMRIWQCVFQSTHIASDVHTVDSTSANSISSGRPSWLPATKYERKAATDSGGTAAVYCAEYCVVYAK